MIILVDGRNNVRADGRRADVGEIDSSRLGIRTGNVIRRGAVVGVKVDIIISKSKIPILISFYLIITILSRLTMYQS